MIELNPLGQNFFQTLGYPYMQVSDKSDKMFVIYCHAKMNLSWRIVKCHYFFFTLFQDEGVLIQSNQVPSSWNVVKPVSRFEYVCYSINIMRRNISFTLQTVIKISITMYCEIHQSNINKIEKLNNNIL